MSTCEPVAADTSDVAADATRRCASCGFARQYAAYSKRQWSLGDGASRCCKCFVRNCPIQRNPTAHTNAATSAVFPYESLESPFAQGVFRYVAVGRYTRGRRAGERCVCKWFKPELQAFNRYAEKFFTEDVKMVDKALRILREWNMRGLSNGVTLQMIRPEVWEFEPGARGSWAGRKVLQEPFIESFVKWNSNTGWVVDSDPLSPMMQALSHFSYFITGGQMLLCDLQGGLCGSVVTLTDPVVLSCDSSNGVTDLGERGIRNFFAAHECTDLCRRNWLRPAKRRKYFEQDKSTTLCLPTAPARS